VHSEPLICTSGMMGKYTVNSSQHLERVTVDNLETQQPKDCTQHEIKRETSPKHVRSRSITTGVAIYL
jgi:hypothetical protein